MVPWVLVFMDLVSERDPCLFHVLDVVLWPLGEQGVECPDVMNDHLVPRVCILLVVLVIDDVCQPTLV